MMTVALGTMALGAVALAAMALAALPDIPLFALAPLRGEAGAL
jgi:hypothetical protein